MPFENFNPLAPRGARRELVQINNEIQIFQSTSSSRSQTQAVTSGAISFGNFNPLAPRGARQTLTPRVRELDYFNPLAPRGARLC